MAGFFCVEKDDSRGEAEKKEGKNMNIKNPPGWGGESCFVCGVIFYGNGWIFGRNFGVARIQFWGSYRRLPNPLP